MGKFEFDDINLEELASSENPVVDTVNLTPAVVDPKVEITPAVEVIENIDNTDDVDLEFLEDSDAPVIENNTEDKDSVEKNKENKDNKDKGAPVKDNASLSSQDTFTSLASALTETGAFSSLSEEEISEIKDVPSLLDSIGKQIKQNELSDLTDNQKQYLEALRNGVPESTFAEKKSTAEQYKQIEDATIQTNPDMAKELIRRSFIIKGFDEKTAENYASLSAKSDTFYTDAFSAKNALVAHEEAEFTKELDKAKLDNATKAEKRQLQLEALKSKLDGESEILKGVKVTTATKAKIYQSMTHPTKMDADNSPLNEVMASYKDDEEYKVRLHTLHVVTKGFTDFSKLASSGKKAAVKDLEEVLRQTGSGVSGGSVITAAGGGKTSREIAEALKNINF